MKKPFLTLLFSCLILLITCPAAQAAGITSIAVSANGEVDGLLDFKSQTFSYSVEVEKDSFVTVTAKGSGSRITISCGNQQASGYNSVSLRGIPADEGSKISVAIAGGATYSIYPVTYYSLSDLKVLLTDQQGRVSEYPLSPSFASHIFDYRVELPNKDGTVSLSAQSDIPGVTLTLPADLMLNPGATVKRSVLVGKDGHNKTYNVTLVRAGTAEKPNHQVTTAGDIVLYPDKTSALAGGQPCQLIAAPFVKDGFTLIPLRFVAENLGAAVNWQNSSKSIEVQLRDINILMRLNSDQALLNGKALTLSQSPIVKSGVTFVPLRFVAENLGATVAWDDINKIINISR